ncbi:MAG: cation diffusion facilitator family transporter [bacterium]|nr:cation diffusion facilitator family transporter [bacterium]
MSQENHGKKSVIAALVGNSIVTVLKGIVFFITGSASMFAESVHSFADTLNQSLLLIGLNRSKKPADEIRGYGYGIERFFWSLISACGILFIGAGITIYHSIESLLHRGSETYEFNILSVIVLVLALIIEGITLWIAIKELKKDRKFSKKLFENADPVLLAIVYEDGAAVLGVIIALLAQTATYLTGDILYDAIGGMLVGLVLGFLAVVLIIKNHQYIIGKPIHADVREEILKLLNNDPCIEQIVEFKSVAVDVGKYRIFVTVEWNGSPLYGEIYEAGDLKEEFENVKDDFKEFTKLMFRTTDRIPRLVGNRIDEIEKNIKEKFPQVAYVDIEIN